MLYATAKDPNDSSNINTVIMLPLVLPTYMYIEINVAD